MGFLLGSSIGFLLLIKWISPQHRMNFSSSSIAFLLISWISFRYLDFSSSLGFLLINWISPHHQSTGFFLPITWISHYHQVDFSSLNFGYLLIIKLIFPDHQVDFKFSQSWFSQSGRWTGDVGKKVAIYILAEAPARKYGSSEEEGEEVTAWHLLPQGATNAARTCCHKNHSENA